MKMKLIKISGSVALDTLNARRTAYRDCREYPFLIGDSEDVKRTEETTELNSEESSEIVLASMRVDLAAWLRQRRAEAEGYDFSMAELLGIWPGEVTEKGSISLHRDILTGNIKEDVYLGFADISEPWQLPAVVKFGAWNDCPVPEVHCAFHRKWQADFGAEIVGMTGDVIECSVTNPPRDKQAAIELAWEQYWYCADIVDQGCESISNLAATLINSNYWYFWWD